MSASRPTPNVRPIGSESTVDRVDRELRRAFVTGALRPGEEFSMAELSAQLEVSHVPLREALRRFEAQGLITLRPARSAIVSPLDADDVEDVYRLWNLICNDVAARACVGYSEQDFEDLATILDEFTALPQDSDEAFDRHYEFHMRLLKPGASAWDLRLLDILWIVMERAVRMAYRAIIELAGSGDPGERAYAAHRPLLDGARARDVTRLQRELRSHHESHMQHVLDAIGASD